MKPNFTLSWFRGHRGHRVERFENVISMHIAYATNHKVEILVSCQDCNSTLGYDFVPLLNTMENA